MQGLNSTALWMMLANSCPKSWMFLRDRSRVIGMVIESRVQKLLLGLNAQKLTCFFFPVHFPWLFGDIPGSCDFYLWNRAKKVEWVNFPGDFFLGEKVPLCKGSTKKEEQHNGIPSLCQRNV
jgi:hypothetical protein